MIRSLPVLVRIWIFYQLSCIKKGFFEQIKNQSKELKMNKLQDMACNWNFVVTNQYTKS
jgi:hypothetical protein